MQRASSHSPALSAVLCTCFSTRLLMCFIQCGLRATIVTSDPCLPYIAVPHGDSFRNARRRAVCKAYHKLHEAISEGDGFVAALTALETDATAACLDIGASPGAIKRRPSNLRNASI